MLSARERSFEAFSFSAMPLLKLLRMRLRKLRSRFSEWWPTRIGCPSRDYRSIVAGSVDAGVAFAFGLVGPIEQTIALGVELALVAVASLFKDASGSWSAIVKLSSWL